MKKIQFNALLLTVFFVLAAAVSASDLTDMPGSIPEDRTLPLLVDDAGLLSSYEASELNAVLDEISLRQEMSVAVITVDELPDGYSSQSYADDIFDYYGYGYGTSDDGILLLLSMEERDWAVTTYGYGITAFPDGIIDLIMNDSLYYISDGDYFGGFSCFAQLCDEYITKAKNGYMGDDTYVGYDPFFGTGDGYYSSDDSMAIIGGADGPTTVTVSGSNPFALPVSLIVGFLFSGLIVGVWKNELRTVNMKSGASDYAKRDSINITLSRDLFLYRTVNRTRRQTEQHNNRSGGMHSGTSVHRSSSGRSHGGRSGKF
ncbi:MAG: TPM domain-containing protein [Clostridia bacterium]|nr:TPM domain-containing protein [Clostridia bacterium]